MAVLVGVIVDDGVAASCDLAGALLVGQEVGRGGDLDARILGGTAYHHAHPHHSLRLVTVLSARLSLMVVDHGGREETPGALASLVVPWRLIDAYLAQGHDLAQELDLLHAVLRAAGMMVHCGTARGTRTPAHAITVTALLLLRLLMLGGLHHAHLVR